MNNKKISADEFHASVERQLSGLKPDPSLARRIIASDKEDKPMKKLSTTFILIAAIICISITALAAGLVFSRRADDITLASRELEKAYGVTLDDNTAMLENVVSRKKQMLPKILENLE